MADRGRRRRAVGDRARPHGAPTAPPKRRRVPTARRAEISAPGPAAQPRRAGSVGRRSARRGRRRRRTWTRSRRRGLDGCPSRRPRQPGIRRRQSGGPGHDHRRGPGAQEDRRTCTPWRLGQPLDRMLGCIGLDRQGNISPTCAYAAGQPPDGGRDRRLPPFVGYIELGDPVPAVDRQHVGQDSARPQRGILSGTATGGPTNAGLARPIPALPSLHRPSPPAAAKTSRRRPHQPETGARGGRPLVRSASCPHAATGMTQADCWGIGHIGNRERQLTKSEVCRCILTNRRDARGGLLKTGGFACWGVTIPVLGRADFLRSLLPPAGRRSPASCCRGRPPRFRAGPVPATLPGEPGPVDRELRADEADATRPLLADSRIPEVLSPATRRSTARSSPSKAANGSPPTNASPS